MLTLSIAVTTVSVNIITVSVAFVYVNFNTLTRCNRLCQHVNTKHCGYNALKLSVVVKTVNDNT